MIYLTIALTAFIKILLIGAIMKFTLGFISQHHSSAFGALCLTLGFAIGRYGGEAESGAEAAALFSGVAGAMLALLALWIWWFKRNGASERQ